MVACSVSRGKAGMVGKPEKNPNNFMENSKIQKNFRLNASPKYPWNLLFLQNNVDNRVKHNNKNGYRFSARNFKLF